MSDDGGSGYLTALNSRLRFGKFVSVGAVGAACDTAVLVFLVEVVGLLEEVAVLIGIETAILIMFLINDNWTFAEEGRRDRRSWAGRLARSHAVRSGGSITQFLVFVFIYRLLFVPLTVFGIDGWLLVAKGSGIALGMLVNYVFESLFTWQVHRDS
jgi:putative flippase GtrA